MVLNLICIQLEFMWLLACMHVLNDAVISQQCSVSWYNPSRYTA